MSVETITQIVLRAQTGDRQAFDELVEQFHARVYGIVMQRLRNTAEADEVTQEVFLRAYRKLDQLQEPAAFAGWLSRIATRLSINRAVRRPAECMYEPQSFDLLRDVDDDPAAGMLQEENVRQLRLGLDRLGQIDRQTLSAFYFEGQSLKEMAEVFRQSDRNDQASPAHSSTSPARCAGCRAAGVITANQNAPSVGNG